MSFFDPIVEESILAWLEAACLPGGGAGWRVVRRPDIALVRCSAERARYGETMFDGRFLWRVG